MFPLMKLPVEIVLRIIDAVHPGDLEALVLCNRIIKTFAEERLCRHRALIQRYSNIFLEEPLEYGQTIMHDESLLFLLQNISREGYLAYYPRKVSIGYCNAPSQDITWPRGIRPDRDSDEKLATNDPIVLEIFCDLTRYIDDCPFLLNDEKDEWRSALDLPGNIGIPMTLLLTRLTSVDHLYLSGWFPGLNRADRIWKMVERIAGDRIYSKSSINSGALSQLQTFTAEFRGDDCNMADNIHVFSSFAMLPSMRHLHGQNVIGQSCPDSSLAFSWPTNFPHRASAITKIRFWDSAVDAQTFRDLFAGIAALEEFTYHHKGGRQGCAYYEPRMIVKALRSTASASLLKLDLTADIMSPCVDEENQYLGSLQSFTALKNIRVDRDIFDGPELDDDGLALNFDYEKDEWPVHRIVDILPGSCETLTLSQYDVDGRIFRDLVDLKAQRLPRIKSVEFEGTYPFDELLRDSLQNVGITISSRQGYRDSRYSHTCRLY